MSKKLFKNGNRTRGGAHCRPYPLKSPTLLVRALSGRTRMLGFHKEVGMSIELSLSQA